MLDFLLVWPHTCWKQLKKRRICWGSQSQRFRATTAQGCGRVKQFTHIMAAGERCRTAQLPPFSPPRTRPPDGAVHIQGRSFPQVHLWEHKQNGTLLLYLTKSVVKINSDDCALRFLDFLRYSEHWFGLRVEPHGDVTEDKRERTGHKGNRAAAPAWGPKEHQVLENETGKITKKDEAGRLCATKDQDWEYSDHDFYGKTGYE